MVLRELEESVHWSSGIAAIICIQYIVLVGKIWGSGLTLFNQLPKKEKVISPLCTMIIDMDGRDFLTTTSVRIELQQTYQI